MFTNTFSVRDSIIADNFASGGSDDIHALGLIVSYSLIGNKSGTLLAEHPVGSPDANGNLIGGPANGVIDPLLGPLADNGGLLLPDGTKMFTHALLPGSPAIDAGDPNAEAGVGDVPEFDQRGEPWSRVVGGRIDMGALEFQANPLPGDYNFNGVVDAADYTVWRDTSSSTTDLRADGSGPTPGVPDGVVDALDYAFWKSQFGNVLGPGAGSREQCFGEIAGELRLAGDGASASGATAIGSEGQAGDSAGQGVGDLRSAGVRGRETRAQQAQREETFAQQVDSRRSDALVHWLATRLPHVATGDATDGLHHAAAAETTADAPALDDAFELLGREGRFHRVFLMI